MSGAPHGGVDARQGGDPATATLASPGATAVTVQLRLVDPSSEMSSLIVTASPSTVGSLQSYSLRGSAMEAVSPTASSSSLPASAIRRTGIAPPVVVVAGEVVGVVVGELALGAVAGSSTCTLLGPESSPHPARSRHIKMAVEPSLLSRRRMASRLRRGRPSGRARILRMRARLSVSVGAGVLLFLASGCGSTPTAPDRAQPQPTPTIPSALELTDNEPARDPRQALALVPDSATVLTITDYDAIRARIGVNDLTSDSLMTDRTAFWEQAAHESVLLTRGLLREDNSVFMLDHGFTQDDVDWEARFTGPAGSGYAVAFRPDLDMDRVRGALKERALVGATLLDGEHLLVKGVADDGDPVWAMDPALRKLTETGAESTYLRRGCVPVQVALGVDATYEDQAALVAAADPTYLRPLEAFSVSFGDQVATARLGIDRIDLHERAHLVDLWPDTGGVGLEDGFEGLAVADPSTGRIGLRVVDPVAAATLTLTEMLPFAACNEVLPFEEPTGL
jgi:hypothetical protein